MRKDPEFQSSAIGQKCIRHWDMFQACAVFTDISVVHYLTEGHKYEATHNHRFPDAVLSGASTERMEVCAYGIEIGHLIGDSIAHSQWIPKRIKSDYLPNIPLHPLLETGAEARIIRDHPEIFQQGTKTLDIIADDEAFLNEMQGYILSSSGVVLDVKNETKFFQDVMGSPAGFYSKAFALPGIYEVVGYGYWQLGVALLLVILSVGAFLASRSRFAIIGALLPFIFTILMILVGQMQAIDFLTVLIFWGISLSLSYVFIRRKYSRVIPILWLLFTFVGAILLMSGGLAVVINTADAGFYLQQAVNEQVKISTSSGWPTRYKYDPTGFAALAEADASIIMADIMIVAFLAGFAGFAFWLSRRRR